MTREEVYNNLITEVSIAEDHDYGILDIKVKSRDGVECQGMNYVCDKTVKINKPLSKIVTTITPDENKLYLFDFTFIDGTTQRIGKYDPNIPLGRQ